MGSVDRHFARVALCVCLLLAGAALLPSSALAIDAPSVAASAPQSPAVDDEAARLRAMLQQESPGLITDTPQTEAAWVQLAQREFAAAGNRIDRAQLLVVVDRNPRAQEMRIVLAQPAGPWASLGGVKVSTGRPQGFEHFLTPTGVFRHTDRILDWRAEGTFNAHHVRGLGVAGMRVWDFGWQRAFKGWGAPGDIGRMRLLMHATDPARLQRRIGRPASDGCIRLPDVMDRFLDAHGVLDADYERAARRNPRFAQLLLPDRTPTPLAGDTLVVIDSSGNPPLAELGNRAAEAQPAPRHPPRHASRGHIRIASAHRHR